MDNFYLGMVIGIISPIALALVVKAIKRTPKDLKSLFTTIAIYIKG